MGWENFLIVLEEWKPLSDWIASLAAFTAVIFAWLGYNKIRQDLKGQRKRIDNLADIVFELRRHNEIVDTATLIAHMPLLPIHPNPTPDHQPYQVPENQRSQVQPPKKRNSDNYSTGIAFTKALSEV